MKIYFRNFFVGLITILAATVSLYAMEDGSECDFFGLWPGQAFPFSQVSQEVQAEEDDDEVPCGQPDPQSSAEQGLQASIDDCVAAVPQRSQREITEGILALRSTEEKRAALEKIVSEAVTSLTASQNLQARLSAGGRVRLSFNSKQSQSYTYLDPGIVVSFGRLAQVCDLTEEVKQNGDGSKSSTDVSRIHVALVLQYGHIFVMDLGSSVGTTVLWTDEDGVQQERNLKNGTNFQPEVVILADHQSAKIKCGHRKLSLELIKKRAKAYTRRSSDQSDGPSPSKKSRRVKKEK